MGTSAGAGKPGLYYQVAGELHKILENKICKTALPLESYELGKKQTNRETDKYISPSDKTVKPNSLRKRSVLLPLKPGARVSYWEGRQLSLRQTFPTIKFFS